MPFFQRCIYLIAAALLVIACSRKAAPPHSTLKTEGLHHKWKLSFATGIQNAADMFLDLRDVYRSSATASCRYFSFTPKFGHNNRIQLDNLTGSLSNCPDDSADHFFKAGLEAVYRFRLTEKGLSLLAKDGHAVFTAQKAADDEHNSIKRKWFIQQMINADMDRLIQHKAFLDLTDYSRANGNAGCNRFSFRVVVTDGYHIALHDIGSTEMYCKDANSNESVFAKVLPLVHKYQVIGDRLKLFDKDNALLLEAKSALE